MTLDTGAGTNKDEFKSQLEAIEELTKLSAEISQLTQSELSGRQVNPT